MKRFFSLFVLTPAEQRLVILLVLLLVGAAWYKHRRDLNYSIPPQPAPGMSPTSQGTALSKPPNNLDGDFKSPLLGENSTIPEYARSR